LLRPLLDDFTFDHSDDGTTRLVGVVRDAAHLHGVVSHMTSVNLELISISPIGRHVGTPTQAGYIPTLHERSTLQ
jgi:hypothetical protein